MCRKWKLGKAQENEIKLNGMMEREKIIWEFETAAAVAATEAKTNSFT